MPLSRTTTRVPWAVEVAAGDVRWWCRCGRSRTPPFCDGSHRGTELAPLRVVCPRSGVEWFCGCKRTATPPYCDGSHKTAPDKE